MRICLLNSHPKYLMGGAELFMYYCAREFVRAGHEVTMVNVTPHGGLARPLPGPQEVLEGIHVIHLPDMATDVKSAWKYLRTLSGIETDVFLKMYTDPSTVLLSWHARRRRIPYVLFIAHDLHCLRDAGLTTQARFYAARYRVSLVTKFGLVTLGAYQWALRGAARVLVQNERQRELLLEQMGIHASDVIPTGHPVPKEQPVKDRPPVAIWNGRFQAWKRPELFLELARRLPHHQFVLSGPTADDRETPYYKEIERQATAIPNVHIFPFPDTFEEFITFPLFGRAALFIDTIEQGGFENTLVQSWLRKTPVVSFSRDFGGLLEREGIGFSCGGDMDHYVATVDRLLSDNAERERVGERCREYAVQHYDVAPLAARIVTQLEAATHTTA